LRRKSGSGDEENKPMNVPLSVVIPIKNEARNIERCLRSVTWASEIYLIDSQSTDDTCRIAVQFGAKVVQFDYHGGWPKKKNWALANVPFENEWVLLLDADEVLMEDGRTEIESVLRSDASIDGYWINRRFVFLGKWLKHSYYPNWNLRLFRHRRGRFEKLVEGETDSGDIEIHEHVIVDGRTGRLQAELEHYAFPTVESFIDKHNRYSNWEAQLQVELDQKRRGPKLQEKQLSFHRRLKLATSRLPMRPFLRFCYIYFLQRGFLDGIEGYYFARLHACYEWMSVIKTFERKRRP
jgi:glycosyltransferase involved in cell wall biosynthesis